MPDFTALKGGGSIGDQRLTQQLTSNFVSFLDWGLLNLGGFFNVYLTDIAPYGGNPSTLRLSDDTRYARGRVWDSFKTNWVWEQGIEYSQQPINISGIYVNSIFLPLDSSVYNINYPQGRVIFTNPIASNSTVQVEYSFKYYNVYPASVQWFNQLTRGTFRRDDTQFNQSGSGIWTEFPESRTQLPAIVVESYPKRDWKGKQLGGGQWIYTDILFHIFAETSDGRDNVLDLLTYQNEKKFYMWNKNAVANSGAYPLNAYGYLVNPQSIYPNLINDYLWRYVIIRDTTAQQLQDEPMSVYRGIVRMTIEVDFPEI